LKFIRCGKREFIHENQHLGPFGRVQLVLTICTEALEIRVWFVGEWNDHNSNGILKLIMRYRKYHSL
jgi:hypothetical protein